ncbi:MAG: COR domain-containing protein [Bacteroidota bacterium]
MLKQELEAVFKVPFTEVDDLWILRQFHHANAYCVDEDGAIYGLAATELAEEVDTLKIPTSEGLVYLNLSGNKGLTQLNFTQPLGHLQHLDVSDTGLQELSLQAGFHRLVWLDAARSALRVVSLLGDYPDLRHLDLARNQLHDFSAHNLVKFPQLERLYLYGNPLVSSKQEAATERGSCLTFLQRFARELGDGEMENKEYKVILLGNGGVGKTCLVERLVHDRFEADHNSTHGVSVQQYHDDREDGYPYLLNLWDFGGQDIYHATHRLFLQANATYLTLWDQQTEQSLTSPCKDGSDVREYANYPLGYWLHYVRHLAGDSPTVVVKSKALHDQRPHPQHVALYEEYQPDKFLYVDSQPDDPLQNRRGEVLQAIQTLIATKGKIEKEFPTKYDALRKELRSLAQKGKKLLTLAEYLEIAQKHQIAAPKKVLQHWLSTSGVVFYRPGYFGDTVILQQGWAIEAIYAIFSREKAGGYYDLRDKQGRFTGADLKRIWEQFNRQYGAAEQELLLSFMMSCELCFEVTPKQEDKYQHVPFVERVFIAPQLLPEEKPRSVDRQVARFRGPKLYARYQHDFLHDGIIQSFMVRAHASMAGEEIWKSGILIEEEGALALVTVRDAKDRGVHAKDIEVVCEAGGIALLDKIRNTLQEIQGKDVRQVVSIDGTKYVDMKKLSTCQDTHIATTQGEVVAVAALEIFKSPNKPTEDQKAIYPRQEVLSQEEVEHKNLQMQVNDVKQQVDASLQAGLEREIQLRVKIISRLRERYALVDDPRQSVRLEIEIEEEEQALRELRAKLQ